MTTRRIWIVIGTVVAISGCTSSGSAPATQHATVEPTVAAAPAATAATPVAATATAPLGSAAAPGSPSSPQGAAALGDILFTYKPGGVDGSDVISAIHADGSGLRRVAPHGWMPDLSPDGKTIAYASAQGDSNMDIYTMNADGSNPKRLTGNDFNGFHPKWSPNGSQIIFSAFPGELYIVDASGSNQHRIATSASMASWSADGSMVLACLTGAGGKDDIFTMTPSGTNPVNLTNNADGDDCIPSMSPDGKHIAFQSSRTGNGDIYVINADGSNLVRLTTDADLEEWPVWSPDGSQIVYTRRTNDKAFEDVWVMNADGTNQTNLTNSPNDADYGPSWR